MYYPDVSKKQSMYYLLYFNVFMWIKIYLSQIIFKKLKKF